MEKYALLRERVDAAGLGAEGGLRVPHAATDHELERVHDAGYVNRVVQGTLEAGEVRRIGFPWSPELVERSRRSVGGTLQAGRSALETGVGVNLAGGTHHAFSDRGEGFCVFNDVAVSIRAMQAEGRAVRAAVVDLDVHQGNGTAAIFRDDPSVFTASVHGERNYPFRKEPGDLDVELPDGTGDRGYLQAVDQVVDVAMAFRPELVYYLAGADPFEGDRLGRLSVTKDGLARRDAAVLDRCSRAGVPVVVVMAGGYGRSVDDTVDIHFSTVARAISLSRTGGVGGG
jgi:acetoin utilization deacetylase AcuC-like enzyme